MRWGDIRYFLTWVGRSNRRESLEAREEQYILTNYVKSKSLLKAKFTFPDFQLIICRSCRVFMIRKIINVKGFKMFVMLVMFDWRRWAHSDTVCTVKHSQQNSKQFDILQLWPKFKTLMVFCLRFIMDYNFQWPQVSLNWKHLTYNMVALLHYM